MAAPLELNRQMLSPELLRQLGESGIEVEVVRDALAPDGKNATSPPRSFRRRSLRQAALAAILIALVAARWKATASPTAGDLPEGPYEVAAVKRADVIELANHLEVRLLGVAPASRSNSDALDFIRDLVSGREVRLQFDRTRLDADGRYLAYVWVPGRRGERLLNEELLRNGLVAPSPATLALCTSSMKRRLTRAAETRAKR